ncbi:hypothetical protein Tco_0782676 [Tanacetum coccineum]
MTARITIPEPLPVPACPIDHWGIVAADDSECGWRACSTPFIPYQPPFILSTTRPDAHQSCLHQLLLHSHHYHYPHDSHREGSSRGELLPPQMGLDSWDEIVETLQGAPVSTDTELGAQ